MRLHVRALVDGGLHMHKEGTLSMSAGWNWMRLSRFLDDFGQLIGVAGGKVARHGVGSARLRL